MSALMRLLRYNSPHRLHFPGDWKLPQLNPVSSSSHTASGRRTFHCYEPTWLFRWRQRVFALRAITIAAAAAKAGLGQSSAFGGDKELPDTWDIGPDGNRTCSYCGSIHTHDLMVICRKTLIDERYGVEGTDKSYKVYVKQPNVRNASEGAIKFYMAHAPADPSKDDQELFAKALRLTSARWQRVFDRQIGRVGT